MASFGPILGWPGVCNFIQTHFRWTGYRVAVVYWFHRPWEPCFSWRPCPHLDYSDHISVMLIPAYRWLIRCAKPILKQMKIWLPRAISALQECLKQTDWDMFREAAAFSGSANLEQYTASGTGYFRKYIDDVSVSKTIVTCPHQKPWMTGEVRMLLRTWDNQVRW